MQTPPTKRDSRVAALAVIWGISAGMLGLCIPLVAIAHSDLTLPLVVILGTVVSTIVVWRQPHPILVETQLPESIPLLEERIANLEVICDQAALDPLPPLLESQDLIE